MPDNFHERYLLVDFNLHVNRAVFFLDITKRIVENKNFWVLNRGAHATISDIFLENHSVDVLAFLLISMLHGDDFDERIEVNGIGKHARRGPNCHYCVLGAVCKDLAPLYRINFVVLDNLVNHRVKMAAQFVIEPLVRITVCNSIADGSSVILQ